eukprot:365660-Chlamydomonas_euryale.AAC.9
MERGHARRWRYPTAPLPAAATVHPGSPTRSTTRTPSACRGEVVRMLFNYGGIEFTEQQFSFEEWGKEWKAKMTEAAFGQVPVLEVDGKMLSQSGAMERYIAKKVGVYPADDWEAAKVEEAVGLVQDMFNTMLFSTTAKMVRCANMRMCEWENVLAGIHRQCQCVLGRLVECYCRQRCSYPWWWWWWWWCEHPERRLHFIKG